MNLSFYHLTKPQGHKNKLSMKCALNCNLLWRSNRWQDKSGRCKPPVRCTNSITGHTENYRLSSEEEEEEETVGAFSSYHLKYRFFVFIPSHFLPHSLSLPLQFWSLIELPWWFKVPWKFPLLERLKSVWTLPSTDPTFGITLGVVEEELRIRTQNSTWIRISCKMPKNIPVTVMCTWKMRKTLSWESSTDLFLAVVVE